MAKKTASNNSVIKYCPYCKNPLQDNTKLAQGIKECTVCDARFLIITTTVPKKEIENNEL